jgi:hypothetical protein
MLILFFHIEANRISINFAKLKREKRVYDPLFF